MRIDAPRHLGGNSVELETDRISENEKIVGWIDEYGTVTDNNGNIIGDMISVKDYEFAALVMKEERVG